jgi:thiol-disulfide isomerase/thioredoxin
MSRRAVLRCCLLIALALVVTSCGAVNLQQNLGQSAGNGSHVTLARLPTLEGKTVDGKQYTLRQNGHPAVVDIWGSWCGPCRRQQPELNAAAQCFMPQGVVFIGVDTRDSVVGAQGYIQDYGVPYPSLFDDSGEVVSQLNVLAPPTTFVADGSGKVVWEQLGGITRGDLEPVLKHLVHGSWHYEYAGFSCTN